MAGEAVALFARTFVIGLAVAVPVGAMSVLCMERTIAGGWRAGAATGLGIATADALYASIAAFGLSALSSSLVAFQAPLRVAGGLALVVMGVRSIVRSGRKTEAPPADTSAGSYGKAVALTLTNPMTIMAFGAVFASAGLSGLDTAGKALLATAGVGAGSLTWWLALVTGVALVRHQVTPGVSAWLARGSGAALGVFGVVAIASTLLA